MKLQLIEQINKIEKLSGIKLLNESGVSTATEMIISKIVGAGEKMLPREIGEFFALSGAKGVLSTSTYRTLLLKTTLTAEEKYILQQVNSKIVSKFGPKVFTDAIEKSLQGLTRAESVAIENRMLDDYFDNNVRKIIANDLKIGKIHMAPAKSIDDFLETDVLYNNISDAKVKQSYRQQLIDSKLLDLNLPAAEFEKRINVIQKRIEETIEKLSNLAGKKHQDEINALRLKEQENKNRIAEAQKSKYTWEKRIRVMSGTGRVIFLILQIFVAGAVGYGVWKLGSYLLGAGTSNPIDSIKSFPESHDKSGPSTSKNPWEGAAN